MGEQSIEEMNRMLYGVMDTQGGVSNYSYRWRRPLNSEFTLFSQIQNYDRNLSFNLIKMVGEFGKCFVTLGGLYLFSLTLLLLRVNVFGATQEMNYGLEMQRFACLTTDGVWRLWFGNVADIGNCADIVCSKDFACRFHLLLCGQYGKKQRHKYQGHSKSLVSVQYRIKLSISPVEAIWGHPEEPMPDYYADYDYWNTWVQDETTDEEDEDEVMTTKDEVMTTKDDDLLFYQDTIPVDKFVPFGKAMGSKRIEKSPTIPVAVLGLCKTFDMGWKLKKVEKEAS
ncbi:hypothetical protein Tco_0072244 [Tanacetum coccineum]